ncbi:MAG TPA: type II toxin-antitoxin system VapB family antitoxin [Bryobacteraceae bacterium]|nr:type II toxin-antitoxin system VapB family antitoxin [Bryobacteraceae bacterium]
MALHIADSEVSRLMTEYAQQTGMSKTEALRRLLREAVQREKGKQLKADFKNVAYRIVEKNRPLNLPPLTKEEADSIFE